MGTIKDDEVHAQLERIAESELFVQGPRLSKFLRYVVEAELSGESEKLNQYAVGQDVFNRSADFDPAIDSIVRVEAGRLRSKLTQYYADLGARDPIVISLPKGGYRVAFERNLVPGQPRSVKKSVFSNVVFTAALVSGVVAILVLVLDGLRPKRVDTASSERTATDRVVTDIPSIAVLPFDNMSGDPSQDYFSDGITEDIITDLSALSGLRVIARNSTFVYKEKPTSIRQIGEDLDVSLVLEGSVRRDGDHLRVTAQLIQVDSQSHLWAERYDRQIDDVFGIQDEISFAVVDKLKLVLSEGNSGIGDDRPAVSIQAYDDYLRAREQFYSFESGALTEALQLISVAIEHEPAFVEAYAWKSRMLTYAYLSGIDESPTTIKTAVQLAERAVEMNEQSSDSIATLAWAKFWNRQPSEAESLIRLATNMNRNSAEAYLWKSLILSSVGSPEDARVAAERSARLNPLYGVTTIHALGRATFEAGDFEGAIQIFDSGIDRNQSFLPNHYYKMFSLEKIGKSNEASAVKAEILRINPNYETSAAFQFYRERLN